MSLQKLLAVTRFEIFRHISVKGELVGLLIILVVMSFRFGGQHLMELASRQDHARFAVVGADATTGMPEAVGRVSFEPIDAAYGSSASLLNGHGFAGLVRYENDGSFSVGTTGAETPPADLQSALDAFATKRALAALGLSGSDLQALRRPAVVHYHDLAGRKLDDGASTRALCIALTSLSLFACIGSFGLLFQTISGEKSDRVSEVVLSSIPAQTWIDGKVLAISLVGLKTIVVYGTYLAAASMFLRDGPDIQAAHQALSVGKVLWTVAFSLAGLITWNSFFAALAASTSGEYGSGRRALFLLPMVLYLVCFAGLDNPGNWFMQVLSYFPGSAMIAMPLRILGSEVPAWQMTASLLLLIASAWLMRSAAGRIFKVGMLMYGKQIGGTALFELLRARSADSRRPG